MICPVVCMPEASQAAKAVAVAEDLRRWLTSGRAQASVGAFCAWRDSAQDKLAFEYPEITGYALTWLASLSHPSATEVAVGCHAADWLVQRLSAGDRSARDDWESGAVYTFDLGMIAAGLISFGRQQNTPVYEHAGHEVAGWLADCLAATGELPAVVPGGPRTARAGGWSTDGRVHLAKCVQCLLLSDNHEAGSRLVHQARLSQGEDGHFVTQLGNAFVMLHPHLYAVEGLWMWATATGDEQAFDSARHATEWAWRQQLPSGGFPRWASSSESGPEQLDATAQAIRAALILGLAPEGLGSAVTRLSACAATDSEYGRALVYRPTDLADHLNTWVTMFGEQALSLASGDADALDWHELV